MIKSIYSMSLYKHLSEESVLMVVTSLITNTLDETKVI